MRRSLDDVTNAAPPQQGHLPRPPGFHRVPGERARWTDPAGEPVTDAATLERLRRLALPPAWTHVWASIDPTSRVQATGVDARGRTQYRYSAEAVEAAKRNKYVHMLDFAAALPLLRSRVADDLAADHRATQTRLTAAVVRLLDLGLFRVGNPRYTRDNHTHGLTTLERQHVAVDGHALRFDYVGKEHLNRHVEVADPASATVTRDLLALDRPGEALLFLTADTAPRHIDSALVNAYIHTHADVAASAKTFRTWGATVVAASVAGGAEFREGTRRRNPDAVPVAAAAHLLGNTPTVARASYVHPDAIAVGRMPPVQDAVQRAAAERGTADVHDIFHDDGIQRAVRDALRDA